MIIVNFYLACMLLTFIYVTIQLVIQMPSDIESFIKYRDSGDLPEDSSLGSFIFETTIAAIFLVIFWPFFIYLEYRRINYERR